MTLKTDQKKLPSLKKKKIEEYGQTSTAIKDMIEELDLTFFRQVENK